MGLNMLTRLFESKLRKVTDASELLRLQEKYGDALVVELSARVAQTRQDARTRKHWQRLLRKAT
jgi:hypothetical protein